MEALPSLCSGLVRQRLGCIVSALTLPLIPRLWGLTNCHSTLLSYYLHSRFQAPVTLLSSLLTIPFINERHLVTSRLSCIEKAGASSHDGSHTSSLCYFLALLPLAPTLPLACLLMILRNSLSTRHRNPPGQGYPTRVLTLPYSGSQGQNSLLTRPVTLPGSDPGTLQGRVNRVTGSQAGSRVP
jgi:hypothetical protein